jgi:YVTN family beta-propeller protein
LAVAAGIGAVRLALSPAQTLGLQPGGGYLVPTNQLVTPVGTVFPVPYARPKDLALSPDGRFVAVLCTSKVLVMSRKGELIEQVAIPPSAAGICWSPSSDAIYASCNDGKVRTIAGDKGTWAVRDKMPVDVAELGPTRDGARMSDPQLLGLAASPDGKKLYVAMGIRNAVAEVDLATGEVVRHFVVGAAPFRVRLSLDGRKLFVTNRGGLQAQAKERSAMSAGTPIAVDARTDASARGSVSIVDLATAEVADVPVGKQPSGLACSADGKTLYVADSDDDTVSVVDVQSAKRTGQIPLRPDEDREFGRMPTDLCVAGDGRTLYVSCGGINAVAVISLNGKPAVAGYVPSAWFPIAIGGDSDGVVVACSKGFGARPPGKTSKFYVHDSVGVVQFVSPGDMADLGALTSRVAVDNRWMREPQPSLDARPVPIPERVGEPSVFKHVVYVIKENMTYDVVLGDMPEGNGDKDLCVFGEFVSPNFHKLARQFVLLDNTYTSGTNSADGHQWTSSSICNAYQEQSYAENQRSYPFDGGDALACSPKGFLWTAVSRRGLPVRVYGEFVNRPKVVDAKTGKSPSFFDFWDDYIHKTGKYSVTAETDNAALRPFLHPNYIGFPATVTDQWRADTFLNDFHQFEKSGRMPALCMLLLPNNHTAGTNPAYPTPRAMVADNDLALGRIVDEISHSKFWKDTLILVIEDDSQTGVDHVDGHRTAAFCISAYTRRGAVIDTLYNHTSLIRTIELVLGVPAMNRFDRSGTPLRDCFTPQPDFTPYDRVANNVALDERNRPRSALKGIELKIEELCEKQDWSHADRADPAVTAQAAWYSQRPGEPFPWAYFHPDDDD